MFMPASEINDQVTVARLRRTLQSTNFSGARRGADQARLGQDRLEQLDRIP